MEDLKKIVKKSFVTFLIIFFIIVVVLIWMILLKNIKNKENYGAGDFGIKTLYSSSDYNDNGIDDYSDFVLGARKNSDKAILSAFSEAGYDLSSVDDLISFFLKYAKILTTDIDHIEEWQPGDIVFFDDKSGIISDKRNKNGVAFVICDEGEKDLLSDAKILFHFRFDMSAVSLKIF